MVVRGEFGRYDCRTIAAFHVRKLQMNRPGKILSGNRRCAISSFAVVMNIKARKVRQSTIGKIGRYIPSDDLYITRTIEQSDECLDEVIQKRYPLVFCGGGDGTAMRIIEQMLNHIKRHKNDGKEYKLPTIGILKLGTGNGWAGLLNTPPQAQPIERIKRGDKIKTSRFNMIRCDDRLTHFAGVGVDGKILNHYIDLKNKYTEGFMWKVANSLTGYLVATFGITLPDLIKHGLGATIRVYCDSDDPVYRVSHANGVQKTDIKRGDLIEQRPMLMAGCATTPNYGFNLKAYPWADQMDGYMQLRLANPPIVGLVTHLPSLWAGKYEHELMNDYFVKRVRVESDQDLPFQMGGDPEGYRKELVWEVAEETVDVLDFRP